MASFGIHSRYSSVELEMSWVGNSPKSVARDLLEVSHRLNSASPVFREIMSLLEEAEAKHFASLNGKYVRSGRLKKSLTKRRAPNAVRGITDTGLKFGTSLFYAKFLTKSVDDPRNAQIVAGRRSGKESAVVVLSPTTRKAVKTLMAKYVTEPYG